MENVFLNEYYFIFLMKHFNDYYNKLKKSIGFKEEVFNREQFNSHINEIEMFKKIYMMPDVDNLFNNPKYGK